MSKEKRMLLSTQDVKIISYWVNDGLRQQEIAQKLGISQPAISKRLKRLGLSDLHKNITKQRTISYENTMDCDIKIKF